MCINQIKHVKKKKQKQEMNEILKEKDWCAIAKKKCALHFLDEAEI